MASQKPNAALHVLGIRHHGPGSARSVVDQLAHLAPARVLIEGPTNASDLLAHIGKVALVPPVALLSFQEKEASESQFWPMAEFSPEYQAALWANAHNVPVSFIDLPAGARFADETPQPSDDAQTTDPDTDAVQAEHIEEAERAQQLAQEPAFHDPIGALAMAAGYSDGESWWNNLIEENEAPGPIFDAIAQAMTDLRSGVATLPKREARREAHMRLQIAAAIKNCDGPVVVICGAWHVPALNVRVKQADDRALLKGMSKPKVALTWVPWSMPRLSFKTGYRAGIHAPGWCQHIWTHQNGAQRATRWLVAIARAMRAKGHMAPPPSLIEAERLANGLAVMRARPRPGFDELREGAVACLFQGESLLWDTFVEPLLLGTEVGHIPSGLSSGPLLEDLQRAQKKARLKPEAIDKELSVDLRSDSGRFRSTLLHRLNILEVPWGTQTGARSSRGTFRENWLLHWQPQYSVQLVEYIVYGPTIAQAADGYLSEKITQSSSLSGVSEQILSAITADLDKAITQGLDTLQILAGKNDDCLDALRALRPMGDSIRYGQARAVRVDALQQLVERLVLNVSVSLLFNARNLEDSAARPLVDALRDGNTTVKLLELSGTILQAWHKGLLDIVEDPQATPLVRGAVAQMLYEMDLLGSDETTQLLARQLSPGTDIKQAAGFFEGFFEAAVARLLYDEPLRKSVSTWLVSLDEADFIANLPIMRRVFSSLDTMERKRLIEAVLQKRTQALPGLQPMPHIAELWTRHVARFEDLFHRAAKELE